MKKTILYILSVLYTALSVFAYTPERIEPVETRAEAFGGPYYADISSVYSFFSNPAALGLAGKKTLWPPIAAIGLGGPIDKLFSTISTGTKANLSADSAKELTKIIGESGFNFGIRLGGPLTFGAIRNNFGWGFINTIAANANIFSITRSDIKSGAGLSFVAGYAFPFDFDKAGVLSIGLSARGMVRIDTLYTQGITELTSASAMEKIPAYLSAGLGFDMGVQYKVFDILSFAAVWQDLYAPVWVKTYPKVTEFGKNGSAFQYEQMQSKLGFGLKADIPIADITRGVISEWAVYTDFNDIWPLFKKNAVYRNPILELAFGTELVLYKIVALRIGVNEMYPAVGLGLNLGKFKMDFSVFGKELGFEPGYNPQLNTSFSMLIKY